jgi:catabolite regulation protein CreA
MTMRWRRWWEKTQKKKKSPLSRAIDEKGKACSLCESETAACVYCINAGDEMNTDIEEEEEGKKTFKLIKEYVWKKLEIIVEIL